jgi:putative membrane protein
MSATNGSQQHQKSLLKGLAAGLIGGLAGTLAKTFAERVFPSHHHGDLEPAEQLAERVAGHELSRETRVAAGQGIHWGFGAAAGAAYGALAEYYPAATSKEGASFGLVLQGLTQEGALPAMGLSSSSEGETLLERGSEMTSHVIYGVVTEAVRKFFRNWM